MSTSFTPDCFDGLHVLVVGDVILDHYLVGRAERISPEAPVPVLRHEEERYSLGGAANVALNITHLGATAHLVAVLGADQGGQRLRSLLQEQGISDAYLLTDQSRQTTQKTRILARQQQLLRYDVEHTHEVMEELEALLLDRVQHLLKTTSVDVIVLQDYNKGLLTTTFIQSLIELAQAHRIPTLADPKKANFLSYRGITWFKPNLREVNEALGLKLDDRHPEANRLEYISKEIRQHLNNDYTLITLGEQGLFLSYDTGVQWAATKPRAVADVCGAGDTVISIVALCVGAGLDLPTTLKLANLAGGQVCEHVGVVPVNRVQLWKEYQQESH